MRIFADYFTTNPRSWWYWLLVWGLYLHVSPQPFNGVVAVEVMGCELLIEVGSGEVMVDLSFLHFHARYGVIRR